MWGNVTEILQFFCVSTQCTLVRFLGLGALSFAVKISRTGPAVQSTQTETMGNIDGLRAIGLGSDGCYVDSL